MSSNYYVPSKSQWPILTSVVLLVFLFGLAGFLNSKQFISSGSLSLHLTLIGFVGLLLCIFGWFRDVVSESVQKLYSNQLVNSFRVGMIWFIFSEVWFFAALFGSLFYVRIFVLPWLSGEGVGEMTHLLLWPNFMHEWPLFSFPNNSVHFSQPTGAVNPFHLPLVNTIILIASSVTLTISHHYLIKNRFKETGRFLLATVLLGLVFIVMQAIEYYEAYFHLNLQLNSGVYGSLFFLMTGFHGVHVAIGTLFLLIIWFRLRKGHFSSVGHFGFEASAWYWHFVDVVWILLFFTVYLL